MLISGHGMGSYGQVSFARFHICGAALSLQFTRICSMGWLGGRAGRIGAIRSYECVTRMFRPSFLRAWFYRGVAVPY